MKRRALALLLLPLAACSILEPKPDRTRSYLLTERAGEVGARAAAGPQIALGVGPIELPAYLDRSEMVTRVPPNKLRFSSLDRWAEPLSANFARVFTADLSGALGTEDVTRLPSLARPEIDYRVAVAVEQFERRSDGVAVLVARWEVRRGARGELVRRARATHEVPIDGATAADAVEALSRATALLADDVAAAILAAPPTP
jgi:uncharacterized protein